MNSVRKNRNIFVKWCKVNSKSYMDEYRKHYSNIHTLDSDALKRVLNE